MRNLNLLPYLLLTACLIGPNIEQNPRDFGAELCKAGDDFPKAEYISDFGFQSDCRGTSSASFFSTQEMPGYPGIKPFSNASFRAEGGYCIIDAEFGYTFEGKFGPIVLELPSAELELCTLRFSSKMAEAFSTEEWQEIEIWDARIDGLVIDRKPNIEVHHPSEGPAPSCTNTSQLFKDPFRLHATLTIAVPQKLMRPLGGLGAFGTRLYWQISE